MVDEVVFVARSGFVVLAVGVIRLLNSGDLLRTAGEADDADQTPRCIPITSGVSRSGSTVITIGCSLVASGWLLECAGDFH